VSIVKTGPNTEEPAARQAHRAKAAAGQVAPSRSADAANDSQRSRQHVRGLRGGFSWWR
jgi:hypothetical protein